MVNQARVNRTPGDCGVDDLVYRVPDGWALEAALAEGRPTAAVFVPQACSASGFVTTLLVDHAEVPASASVESILAAGDAHLRSADAEVAQVWHRTAMIGEGPAAAKLSVVRTAAWPTPVLQLRAVIDRGATERARRIVTVVLTCDAEDGERFVPDAISLLEGLAVQDAVSES